MTDSRRQRLENVGVVIKDTRPFEERPIQGPDRFFGTSDKAGRYEIQGILPGPYTVSVAPANFRYGGNVLPVDIRVEPRGLPSEMSRGVLSVSTDQNVEGVDLELPVYQSATLIVSVVRPMDVRLAVAVSKCATQMAE